MKEEHRMSEATKGDELMAKLRKLTDREMGLVIAHLIGQGEVFADHGNTEMLDYIEKAIDEVKA